MEQISFESDYIEGAHPAILQRLLETNMSQVSGYGHDEFCESAKAKIRSVLCLDDAQIQFITGGTQTNQIVIDAMLKQYEGVIAAQTGHVNCHEAGAIEYTGHKVLSVLQHNGKIDSRKQKVRLWTTDAIAFGTCWQSSLSSCSIKLVLYTNIKIS